MSCPGVIGRMAGNLSCSFAIQCNSSCGISCRNPNVMEFVPLTSCQKDIKCHVKQLDVGQKNVSSEKDLILARVGMFAETGNVMTICPRHRSELGLNWKRTRASKCAHPLRGLRKGKPEQGANLQMSKEIMEIWKVLVPVGSGMYLLLSKS